MGLTFETFLVCWRWRHSILLAGLVLVVAASSPSRSQANGGTLRLNKARTGPYLISAWTQPDPPRVGLIDLSVAVMRPFTAEPLLDAAVRVVAESSVRRGTPSSAGLERGVGGNLLLYHGELEVPTAGPWRITLTVEGPAGAGQAMFELEVRPPEPLPGLLLLGLVGVVIAGALGWFLARSRRRKRSG